MSISSLSLSNASRATILRLQSDLKNANTELSTGRHADVGKTLGRLSGSAVSYHSQETSLDRMLTSNKLVASRLDLADDSMDSIAKSGQSLQSAIVALTAATSDKTTVGTVMASASSALQSMTGSLNTSVSGQYLFAGAQTDLLPMKDGTGSVTSAFNDFLQAVTNNAQATDPSAPAVTAATVSADDLKSYFSDAGYTDTTTSPPKILKFSDSFTDASWSTNWSSASDVPVQVRISKNETIDGSLSANDAAFRKVAAAYSMLSSLGIDSMGDAARSVVANQAYSTLTSGLDGITALRAEVGVRQNRIDLANTALTQQKDIVTAAIDRLEGVDPAEASLNVTQLETQLEASYTVTGRLQGLSILDYL